MASVKIILLLLLAAAFVYIVYRTADWFFTKKEREDRIDARMRVWKQARDAGIWADDDPETFDQVEYEQAARELGLEMEDL